MNSIERYAALMECSTEKSWLRTLIRMGRDHGYERTLIATVPDRNALHENAFIRGNYPLPWRHTYDAEKYAYIDPVVAHCLTRSTPLIWKPQIFSRKLQRGMYEEACSHGIRSGITLPFHGVRGGLGILCFVSDVAPDIRFRDEALHNLPALSLLRDFAFDTASRFTRFPDTSEDNPVMTGREMECLKWGAAGKSLLEIGKILHCSEYAVKFHFSNIRRKLKAKTRQHAIVKALRMGILSNI